MSKIISIGTAVPAYCHQQDAILDFMTRVYALNPVEARKLRFLYHQSGIASRHSVLGDYGKPPAEWKFYPATESMEPFPALEQRMEAYHKHAAPLSLDAIRQCLQHTDKNKPITHLITVSCTGMSAPGLDLELMELLDLPRNINRTSVNFMGCYAAIHALKMADYICTADRSARVLLVCTELCTLHFQKEANTDNLASSLLFADGSAAALVTADTAAEEGLHLRRFYSEVVPKGKKDMSWELSSSGFLMTLSGYVPDLIEADFLPMVNRAMQDTGYSPATIGHWCIHPGGKKILDVIRKQLQLPATALEHSETVLRENGNMSSPTLLFVLKRIMDEQQQSGTRKPVFAAAFGPGLTMETFIAHS